jgi:hypothetical protein
VNAELLSGDISQVDINKSPPLECLQLLKKCFTLAKFGPKLVAPAASYIAEKIR